MKSSLANQGFFSLKLEEIVKSVMIKKNQREKKEKSEEFEQNLRKCLKGE